MDVLERVIEYHHNSDVVRIYFLTDWHLGSIYCDERRLQEDIERVASDSLAWWIGGGDLCDFIQRRDPRHVESTLAPWLWGVDDVVQAQIERACKIIEPVREKCLALVKGNHEDLILTRWERDVYQRLVERVTVPGRPVRLGYGGFLVLRLRLRHFTWTCVGFIHHGAGGGLLPGGHALTLGRLPMWYDADFYLLGHRHVRQVLINTQWRPSPRAQEILFRRQVMAFGGCYLKGYDKKVKTEPYTDKQMLPPKETGGVVLELRPARRELNVSF